jgi:hypothetical protein
LEKENDVEVTEMLRYKDLTTFYKGQTGFISNYPSICRFSGISVMEGVGGEL